MASILHNNDNNSSIDDSKKDDNNDNDNNNNNNNNNNDKNNNDNNTQIGKIQLYFIWLNHVLFDLSKLSKDTDFKLTFETFSSVKQTVTKNF